MTANEEAVMIAVGIDPGTYGALVAVDRFLWRTIAALQMPLDNCGGAKLIDWSIVKWMREHEARLVIVERQQAYGGRRPDGRAINSHRSTWTTAGLYHSLLTILRHEMISTIILEPQRWKRRAGLLGAPKRAALQVASRIYGKSLDDVLETIGRQDVRLAVAEAALLVHAHE